MFFIVLAGSIPPSIFNLPVLRDLYLCFNQLSGPIQVFDNSASQLENVCLRNNALSGFFSGGLLSANKFAISRC